MKKFFKNNLMLIVGIFLFLIGLIQPALYDNAKNSGFEVDAKIVEVKVKTEYDYDGGPDSTAYTVYADYEVDGKEYKHVKIGKYYDTDDYYVGKTMKVVIDPNNPGKTMFEGGILATIGFVVTVIAIVIKISSNKKQKLNTAN